MALGNDPHPAGPQFQAHVKGMRAVPWTGEAVQYARLLFFFGGGAGHEYPNFLNRIYLFLSPDARNLQKLVTRRVRQP